nr:hypothetical protein [Tanacetum cinerariifolium]
MQKSTNWTVHGIQVGKLYQVDDRRKVHQVNLTTHSCSCRKWQLFGIPCGHVIAVGRVVGYTDCSQLALGWFKKTMVYSTYQELVYPLGEPATWQCLDGLQVVKPPLMDRKESTLASSKISKQSMAEFNIPINFGERSQDPQQIITLGGNSQEYEAAYTNFGGRSQDQ